MNNYFTKLNSINVSEHMEKKGQFSYLSWPYAVAQLRQADPTATWEVRRFDGLPFLKTDCGYFVEVEVVVNGVRLSQIHPVLDARNKPLKKPSAFRHQQQYSALPGESDRVKWPRFVCLCRRGLARGRCERIAASTTCSRNDQCRADCAHQIAAETGQTLQRLLSFLHVEAVEQIPASEYPRVEQLLERSKRKAA
jgi:hypothetical protein